jgi:DNA-binding NtrC family response regulator
MTRVLWISEFPDMLPATPPGVELVVVAGGVNGIETLRLQEFPVAVLSVPVADWNTAELLEELMRVRPACAVLVHDPTATLADAARLARIGASHVLGEIPPPEDFQALLEGLAASRAATRDEAQEPWRRLLVGDSPAMRQVANVIRLVGERRCTVLVTGETGTGKELVARALHLASGRGQLPLIAVNCSALPENLLEAELFGHVKGAFTGATNTRIGRFEQANKSTIFLDEIADLPYELQTKLLRVLQEREIQRLGSSETIRIDVRVVAACNVDLAARVRQGKFREDLFYRLNVVPIAVPPLRDRLSDVPVLVTYFLEKICRQEGIPQRRITRETLNRLAQYSWPGNVRQLENAVEMAIALSGDRDILFPSDFPLPLVVGRENTSFHEPDGRITVPEDGLDFETVVGTIEKSLLIQALERAHGNKKAAADLLRLKRTTFAAKLKSLEEIAS